jgi:hypothetical protein
MKWSKFFLFAFVLSAGAMLMPGATFYSYDLTETLPCNSSNCSGSLTLTGSVTTAGLGALSANDISVWDLTMSGSGQTSIRLTQNNSTFSTFGSVQIQATANDLTFTSNSTNNGFTFGGSAAAPATWIYGASSSSIFTFGNGDDQLSAVQMLSFPSTFTAELASASAVPEPGSWLLMVLAGTVFLGIMLCSKTLSNHGPKIN